MTAGCNELFGGGQGEIAPEESCAVFEEIIRSNTTVFVRLTAMGGPQGRRQLTILDRSDPEYYGGSADIYGSLSDLLRRKAEDIRNGKFLTRDPGQCHRCIEPNFEGESDSETWLILGGMLYCHNPEGEEIVVEAKKRAQNTENEALFFRVTSPTLSEALQKINDVISEYDISELAETGLLKYDAVISEGEVQQGLEAAKKH